MQKDRSIILMDKLSNFEVSIVKKRVNVAKSAKPVKNILKYKRWQIIQALGELRYYRLAANINRFNFKQTISALPKCTINDLYWKLYGAEK